MPVCQPVREKRMGFYSVESQSGCMCIWECACVPYLASTDCVCVCVCVCVNVCVRDSEKIEKWRLPNLAFNGQPIWLYVIVCVSLWPKSSYHWCVCPHICVCVCIPPIFLPCMWHKSLYVGLGDFQILFFCCSTVVIMCVMVLRYCAAPRISSQQEDGQHSECVCVLLPAVTKSGRSCLNWIISYIFYYPARPWKR